MNLAVITPLSIAKALELNTRPMHMCLAHLALEQDSKEYIRFYKSLEGYKILDNSLMENGHQALPLKDVLTAGARLRAQEIVLTDVFRDGPATLRAVDYDLANLPYAKTHSDAAMYFPRRLAAVAQGDSFVSWTKSFLSLLKNPYINVIHVPKVLDEIIPWGGRLAALQWINHAYNHYKTTKPVHLLGIWTNPLEMLLASQYPWIRSVDTALPVQAGLQGEVFTYIHGVHKKTKRLPDYFNLGLPADSQLLDYIKHNIKVLDEFCQGHNVLMDEF